MTLCDSGVRSRQSHRRYCRAKTACGRFADFMVVAGHTLNLIAISK